MKVELAILISYKVGCRVRTKKVKIKKPKSVPSTIMYISNNTATKYII